VKIGTAPNWLPTCPGDHVVPVKKYQKLLNSKKAIASKSIENKIPKVVRIEMVDAVIKSVLIIRSLITVDLFFDSNECKTILSIKFCVILFHYDYKTVTL